MDEIVKDFLIESNENLDRLDQELVKTGIGTVRPRSCWRAFFGRFTPSRAAADFWDLQGWKKWRTPERVCSPYCVMGNSP